MPCGVPKMSPRTSPIVQIIFSFWSFEISEGILRNQKIIIGLDSFSNQRLIHLALFRLLAHLRKNLTRLVYRMAMIRRPYVFRPSTISNRSPMTIIVKPVYWCIFQSSGERLQDHWSSSYLSSGTERPPVGKKLLTCLTICFLSVGTLLSIFLSVCAFF